MLAEKTIEVSLWDVEWYPVYIVDQDKGGVRVSLPESKVLEYQQLMEKFREMQAYLENQMKIATEPIEKAYWEDQEKQKNAG